LPPIVVAIIWKVLFTPDISVLNWGLGLLGLRQPAWLSDPSLALPAIAIADIWEWFPFTMLMLLAALQMMPDEPLEAARIDGASAWQVFLHIVLPLLRPALVVTALFRLIESVKAFPLIFVMTGGGPGTVTEATNYYAYLLHELRGLGVGQDRRRRHYDHGAGRPVLAAGPALPRSRAHGRRDEGLEPTTAPPCPSRRRRLR
jgi:ABC-type sugar transport system permease subunit